MAIRQFPPVCLLTILSLAILLLPLQVQAAYPCSASQSTAWQICGPIESGTNNNSQPSVIQASDGTLRMVWKGLQGASNFVVEYASGTWNGTGWNWTPGADITTQSGKNGSPALAQLGNGTLYMFWPYKPLGHQNFQLYYLTQFGGGAFSKNYRTVPMSSTPYNDTAPSATIGRDGTLWLVWTRDNSTASGIHVFKQLWYKTLKAGVWSNEQPLTQTNDPNWNTQPSIMVGKDGIVRIAFSRGINTAFFDIYNITYNGSVWSQPRQLTTQTTTTDNEPSIMQDRNGTLWLFWTRTDPASTALLIYGNNSTNGGLSWRGETQLTAIISCGTGCFIDSEYPSAVQSGVDKNIWVFYSTDIVANFDIYGLKTTNPISPVHDVIFVPYTFLPAPLYFLTNTSWLYNKGIQDPYGWRNGVYSPIDRSAIVQVSTVIQNLGDLPENVTLSLTATNTTTGYINRVTFLKTNILIQPGASFTLNYNWNLTGYRPEHYGIQGNASIPVETFGNRPDSIASMPTVVWVLPPGDVDQDGSVTITDATIVFFAFNLACTSASSCSAAYMAAQWDAFSYGIQGQPIDIIDAAIVSHNYNVVA